MRDYSKGKQYALVCDDTKVHPNLAYIGSTIQTLGQRMKAHRGDA